MNNNDLFTELLFYSEIKEKLCSSAMDNEHEQKYKIINNKIYVIKLDYRYFKTSFKKITQNVLNSKLFSKLEHVLDHMLDPSLNFNNLKTIKSFIISSERSHETIKELNNLEELSLSGGGYKNIRMINFYSKLKKLDIKNEHYLRYINMTLLNPKNLLELNLTNNDCFTDKCLEPFVNLKTLKSRCDHVITDLNFLTNLEELTFEGRLLKTTGIKKLTKLKKLDISFCFGNNRSVILPNCVNILNLNISGNCMIENKKIIETFQKLKILNISKTLITEIPEFAPIECLVCNELLTQQQIEKYIDTLNELYLDNNNNVNNVDNLYKLHTLSIPKNKTITKINLFSLTNLQISDRDDLTNHFLRYLHKLKYLDINNCPKITQIDHLTELIEIDVGGKLSRITFDDVKSLPRLKKISSVYNDKFEIYTDINENGKKEYDSEKSRYKWENYDPHDFY